MNAKLHGLTIVFRYTQVLDAIAQRPSIIDIISRNSVYALFEGCACIDCHAKSQ